ncbi:hypothetical protein [Halorubrum sp. HHNYT27]|uniref:hypothetical protein n=1 Tax=Halorubrum sp. HHNYT27 TaxID=3402275 RepID=UPI003EBCD71D
MNHEDPRITGAHVRSVETSSGTVTLVGVVHDHPASVFRVRTIISERDPDVLALELPPLSLPLFERYAEDTRTPPVFGGEVSAAIQAADTDRVEGIDGPTPHFLRRLLATLYREDDSLKTALGVFRRMISVTKTTISCRFAGTFASMTAIRLEVDSPATYSTDRTDSPERQAENEGDQIARAQAVMDAFEPSRASCFSDEVRESHMADRLGRLRHDGDTVAVVGRHHLDRVADLFRDRLRETAPS